MIWLLRHGEAADSSPDHDRPLTRRGEAQARAAGAALKAMGAGLEACLSSPKVRASETARLACEELGLAVEVEHALEGGPFEPAALSDGRESVLLVGHDPDLSMAVHRLTGAQVRMKKGGLAGIDSGELIALLRPTDLEAMGA